MVAIVLYGFTHYCVVPKIQPGHSLNPASCKHKLSLTLSLFLTITTLLTRAILLNPTLIFSLWVEPDFRPGFFCAEQIHLFILYVLCCVCVYVHMSDSYWFLFIDSAFPTNVCPCVCLIRNATCRVWNNESESYFLYSVLLWNNHLPIRCRHRAGVQPIGCRLGPRPRAQACG